MNDETKSATQSAEQWAAFQKIWSDTLTKMMQLGFTFSPESAPPELLRQIRTGIFQALSQSWDEFLRSPQFMESMKQWMDNALAYRKMTNDFLTKARHETQTPARDDIDGAMLAVRHMETSVLGRVEGIARQIAEIQRRLDALTAAQTPSEPTLDPKPASGRKKPGAE